MITKQNVSETLRDYATFFSEDSKVLRANMLAVADWLEENKKTWFSLLFVFMAWLSGAIIGFILGFLIL